MLTKEETQDLLSKLCVKLGFCDSDDSFYDVEIETVDEFVKAVIRADGLELDEGSELYKQVRQVVHEAFEKHLDLEERRFWLEASESSLAAIWDNPDDDGYSDLISNNSVSARYLK